MDLTIPGPCELYINDIAARKDYGAGMHNTFIEINPYVLRSGTYSFTLKLLPMPSELEKGGIWPSTIDFLKVGKSAEEILAKHSGTFENARMAKGVKSTFDLMKGSYYKGYRFVDDKDIGVQPVLEERVKISPLIRLSGVSQKKKLGELLLDKTPVGMIINLGKSATGGTSLGISRMFLSKISYTSAGKKVNIGKQVVGWYGAATYPLRIVNKGLTLTYNLLAFATNEAIKKVFGAEAEFEKDISAHLDLDFWLKIQNASSKMDLISIAKGASSNDKSSISIAPSGAFTVRLKFSGKVSDSVIVRAMHILTIKNKEQRTAEKLSAEEKFEVEGNIFIERRYYFEANKKPHYEDSGKFSGLAGEYEYKISAPGPVGERPRVVKKKEPTHFILMEAYEIKFNSSEMTRDPSK